MVKAQATAEQFSEAPVIFDRGILLRNTMDDLGLATEVLALFEAQLQRLELLDWDKLNVEFEMHTLRGAAAAVGARQLQHIAESWKMNGNFETAVKAAIHDFRLKVIN